MAGRRRAGRRQQDRLSVPENLGYTLASHLSRSCWGWHCLDISSCRSLSALIGGWLITPGLTPRSCLFTGRDLRAQHGDWPPAVATPSPRGSVAVMEKRFAFEEGGEGNLIRANQFIGPSPNDNVAGAPVLPSLTQRVPLAGPRSLHGRRAGSWSRGWVLGRHCGLQPAMPTVHRHDVDYQVPDALTGRCHLHGPSPSPSIGCLRCLAAPVSRETRRKNTVEFTPEID